MKIQRYSDYSISFIFELKNKELDITLQYPQIRLSSWQFRFNIPTVFSICKVNNRNEFYKYKTSYWFEFILLGFGLTMDLDCE